MGYNKDINLKKKLRSGSYKLKKTTFSNKNEKKKINFDYKPLFEKYIEESKKLKKFDLKKI